MVRCSWCVFFFCCLRSTEMSVMCVQQSLKIRQQLREQNGNMWEKLERKNHVETTLLVRITRMRHIFATILISVARFYTFKACSSFDDDAGRMLALFSCSRSIFLSLYVKSTDDSRMLSTVSSVTG